jgi:hypothetical protein
MPNHDNVLDRIAGKRDVKYERKKTKIREAKEEKFKIKQQYYRMLRKTDDRASTTAPPITHVSHVDMQIKNLD